MHLLLAQQGALSDADEAVDLGQTPADIVFLSAADTEIAALSAAQRDVLTENADAPRLRCASLTALSHNMSVDVYVNDIVSNAKLVVLRVLGGAPYWQYGLEACLAACAKSCAKLVVLPGDDKPDPSLSAFQRCGQDDLRNLWAYFNQGGPANMRHALDYCSFLLERGSEPPAASPFLKAGLWWPNQSLPSLDSIKAQWIDDAPVVAISFYRALVQSAGTAAIEALIEELFAAGANALPIFVSSLKDGFSQDVVRDLLAKTEPKAVINCTGFAVSAPGGDEQSTVLDESGCVVLQAILAGGDEARWKDNVQGLSARDLAMNVALPEVDGRIITRAIAFKSADNFDVETQTNIVSHQPQKGRVKFVAQLATNWGRLASKRVDEKRVAIILANYPNRDGRLGNGVGLDTPAGTIEFLKALNQQGYKTGAYPDDGNALIDHLMAGPTNAANDGREIRETISLSHYKEFLHGLPVQIQNELAERWGEPQSDPFFVGELNAFALPVTKFGNIWCGIQPARGYNIDPKETYHSPDLVPPHGYLAFYAYLRNQIGIDAFVHMGKHGNLEWLPGKALALSETCYPEVILGPTPHFYPFIVNDPGEGTQAKRRSNAVIVDHLTPPLTRAETYGPLRDLEALVDEYYQASGSDPRRLVLLKKQIMDQVELAGLDTDAGMAKSDSEDEKLEKLDAYLCDLKEMQIRDGLHIFGVSPEGRLNRDLVVALARLPRGLGQGGDESLHRAIAKDLNMNFDPLDCDFATEWTGPKSDILAILSDDSWRTNGDSVERIELLAEQLVNNNGPACGEASQLVLETIRNSIGPTVAACGPAELDNLLLGLAGKHVAPAPSGAPTRGRLDVLPTGRNFYSVDSRAVPTHAAWELGQKSAELVVMRFVQDNGDWPTSFGLSAWGTANMRTGGDDIAQALAFIGAKPVWDNASRRVTGYQITPLAELGRPRVDVTLRISGFFRDAFPTQISLFDQAVRAIAGLDEPDEQNPIAARFKKEKTAKLAAGLDEKRADAEAGYRIFGSKPGAYGAGLQAMMDEKIWDDAADLAESYMVWGSYAYGAKTEGEGARGELETRLSGVEAVVHNQDNREHDLLDSDDYYQFEGGMTVAVEQISGKKPEVYHNDHSRPERPVVRRLEEEIGRVVRARATNPKWIAGVMRHGYKGAFEMTATVDYLFAFAATTGAVSNHHFEAIYDAYLNNEDVREFLRDNNENALKDIAARLQEAIDRHLWTPRRNSVTVSLSDLMGDDDG